MKVTVAKHAGFCFGVERAIDLVNNASQSNSNVVTYGPIIHNPQVVRDLESKGVLVKEDISDIEPDMTAVIRTHGIPIDSFDKLMSRTSQVIDATCPFVQKVQQAAKELSDKNYEVIVVGEYEHPEIQGIISYIKANYHVILSVEDVENIPYRQKYGVVAQTTQNENTYQEILGALKAKCAELKVYDTICNATHSRQRAATELAASVDVMVIVGGKNSANTTRLYKLCKEVCENTYHIETIEDLIDDTFIGYNHVGISAGASTPTDLVYDVKEYILEKGK